MVKMICYIMSALCAFLAVVSFLDVVDVVSVGMEARNLAIGVVGCGVSLFLGRNISHMERDEAHRGGPGLRR